MSEWRDLPNEPAAVPDPWSDGPAWSDESARSDESAASGAGEGGTHRASTVAPGPTPPSVSNASVASAPAVTCSWCATVAPAGATRCPSCDAALAQRESIGDLVIPGLTSVDPALQDYASRPLHLAGPSPSQGVASGAIVAAAAGGPLGLAIIGGIGVVAAAEYMGAGRGPHASAIGATSDAVRQAIERLDRGEALPAPNETTPRPELAAPTGLAAPTRLPASRRLATPSEHAGGAERAPSEGNPADVTREERTHGR